MTYPINPNESERTAANTPSLEDTGSGLHTAQQIPVKVCASCSVQSQTAGSFCPHCAASYSGPGPRRKISKRIAIGAVAALVVAGSAPVSL